MNFKVISQSTKEREQETMKKKYGNKVVVAIQISTVFCYMN